jgi:PadR family transcriptional regulator PadR
MSMHDRLLTMAPIRPSLSTFRILRAMLDNAAGQHYGLELSAATGVRTGALYPILSRLEAAGWIAGRWEDIDESVAGRRRRRYYQLSADGERSARALLERVSLELHPPSVRIRKPAWSS